MGEGQTKSVAKLCDLDAIEALEMSAPPGPWSVEHGGEGWQGDVERTVAWVPEAYTVQCEDGDFMDVATAEFIASARSAVPTMVAKLREARAEITRLHSLLLNHGVCTVACQARGARCTCGWLELRETLR